LSHHTDYPDYTQHVVGMGMGHKEVMNVRNLNIYLLQLREDSVSSARIHQHQSAGSLEQETGIINLGNRSISRSEHRNFIHLFFIFRYDFVFPFTPISLSRIIPSKKRADFQAQNYSFFDKPPRKSPKNFAYSK